MSEAEDIFTPEEMIEISGVNRRTVHKWVQSKLIDKPRQGKNWRRNMWALDEIFDIRVVRLLRVWDFNRDDIQKVLYSIHGQHRFLFVTIDDKGDKVLTWDKKTQRERTAEAETVFCLNVEQVWRQVKRKSVELLSDRCKVDDEEFGKLGEDKKR